MTSIKLYLDSLGCAKNLVDSEMALGLFKKAGFVITTQPEVAQVIMINTCGFILDAKEESINRILSLAQLKTKELGNCQVLVVTGCLSEKYQADLAIEIPEVDLFLGTSQYDILIESVLKELQKKQIKTNLTLLKPDKDMSACFLDRILLTPSYYGYLKIAEGCSNNCTFCIIPQMRGKLQSRSKESLVAEAKVLRAQGVQELILIAQDTTAYGLDLGDDQLLSQLLQELGTLGFPWIRVLYSYANRISNQLLKTMAETPGVCPYLDIPLQHVSGSVLKRMGRTYDRKFIEDLFASIKTYLPDVAIRTTFMVGFPGETEADFQELLCFVKTNQLTWAGVFMYSQEEGTKGAELPNQIPEPLKVKRYNQLMAALALSSGIQQQRWLNQQLTVVLEGEAEDFQGYWQARSQYHAPGVDGIIYVENASGKLTPKDCGTFAKVNIHTAQVYDLIGSLV